MNPSGRLGMKLHQSISFSGVLMRVPRADAVFFTGGDQLRITSILGGTRAYQALLDAYRRGALIAMTKLKDIDKRRRSRRYAPVSTIS